ncbi:hypothetical protein OG204_04115 [Streptomyces sp. NBC_01387]
MLLIRPGTTRYVLSRSGSQIRTVPSSPPETARHRPVPDIRATASACTGPVWPYITPAGVAGPPDGGRSHRRRRQSAPADSRKRRPSGSRPAASAATGARWPRRTVWLQ